jgi:hypothetical protein
MSNYIKPNLIAMTPLAVYKALVRTTVDSTRYSGGSLSYVPNQLGGVSGQAEVLRSGVVLNLVDFKVDEVSK